MAFPHDGRKFVKGQSGNMQGRPKSIPNLRETFESVIGQSDSGQYENVIEAIISKLIEQSLTGDIRAIEYTLKLAYPKGLEVSDAKPNYTIVWNELKVNNDKQ